MTEYREPARPDLRTLALGALGIVYGDIGTSPLYALRECFWGTHAVPVQSANVLGILSLVFWSLTVVVAIKYLTVLMQADNHGEGGILALLALVVPAGRRAVPQRSQRMLVWLGLFGAALLYGDGILTPAISVLSAVEGVELRAPVLQPFIVPITVGILALLFMSQRRGTGSIGAIFGPTMVVWFLAIASAGAVWIVREPRVLLAVSPLHAARFLVDHGRQGFMVLGAVVLCITGGEALYADMGHFGKRPIRLAWYVVVFPALLLNYFGQGALLIRNGAGAVQNPFYAMLPSALLYPMVALATAATVIASQALISGIFSLTRQAVQLGYLPRVRILHTSGATEGQIWVPGVNLCLALSCIALVIWFRESSNLAAAYGIAVTGTMAITSMLLYPLAATRWGRVRAALLVGAFLAVDLAFLSSNVVKIVHGAWVPIVVAIVVFTVMSTWSQGQAVLLRHLGEDAPRLEAFVAEVARVRPMRVSGTAVFMSPDVEFTPRSLLHHFKHNKTLHQQVLLLALVTSKVPEVAEPERCAVEELGEGFVRVRARYGFMQTPDVAKVLQQCKAAGVPIALNDVSFFLGRVAIVATAQPGMRRWRKSLFAFLQRNARPATYFFELPLNRVVEMGVQVEI